MGKASGPNSFVFSLKSFTLTFILSMIFHSPLSNISLTMYPLFTGPVTIVMITIVNQKNIKDQIISLWSLHFFLLLVGWSKLYLIVRNNSGQACIWLGLGLGMISMKVKELQKRRVGWDSKVSSDRILHPQWLSGGKWY